MNTRLGAGSYLLMASLLFVAWSALTLAVCELLAVPHVIGLSELNLLVSSFGSVLGVCFYWLSARRLKDLNAPGWLVKVLAFPLLALILMPYLCFVSGPQRENQYGSAPPSSGFGKVVLAVVTLFVAINMSFFATADYFRTKHLLVHAQR